MTPEQISVVADRVIVSVKGFLSRSLEPVLALVDALEKREPLRGERGEKGEAGERGEQGLIGEVGPIGESGLPGPIGIPGPAGPTGSKGEQGDAGPIGPIGEKGADGPTGLTGPQGPEGPRGERGELGLIGPTGEKGAGGPQGKDADPLIVAAMVAKAVSEIAKPEDGRDGLPGEPGRDAFAIEVQQSIDETRRYQRGSWARHNGGLWMARAATNGMDGWECIVDGVAGIGFVEVGDVRSFKLSVATSSGKNLDLPFTVPAMIYRGIWKEGDTYQRGDTTTRDGSTWSLMETEQKGKPGEADSGWVLAAKRGRDGRDGIKGAAGERGAEGRAGHDLTQLGHNGARY